MLSATSLLGPSIFRIPTSPKASNISPPQICPNIRKTIPRGTKAMFTHFRIRSLLILAPKNQWARAGKIKSETISAATSAKVFVNARGPNNFPSAACIVNTGIKLTIVVDTAVRMAELTSDAPLYIVVISFCPGGASSTCLMMFSDRMTPRSTIVPIAMAIPDKATILASTPK